MNPFIKITLLSLCLVLMAAFYTFAEDCCGGEPLPEGMVCCEDEAVLPEECCGDELLPGGMICCENEAVAPDECCDEKKLSSGEECCRQADPELPYNPDTTCCIDTGLMYKGAFVSYQYMIEHCPDYVYRTDFIPTPNGCSNPIPIEADEFFKICCNVHDIDYATCRKSKESADNSFLSCMVSECFLNIGLINCYSLALIYFTAVAQMGDASYELAQSQACQCCE